MPENHLPKESERGTKSLSWYEESARYLAKVRPDVLLINATEGGVRIRGFDEMSLAEACSRFCQETFRIHEVLQGRFEGSGVDRASLKGRLLRMKQDLEFIDDQDSSPTLPTANPGLDLYEWLSRGGEGEDLRHGKRPRTERVSEVIHQARQWVDRMIRSDGRTRSNPPTPRFPKGGKGGFY